MPTITRTLNAIPAPGTWSPSAGDLVAAIGAVGGEYGVSTASGQLYGSIVGFDIPSGATVVAVRCRATVRLAEAGTRDLSVALRSPGAILPTSYHPTIYFPTSTSWTDYTWEWTTHPVSGLAWTIAEVNFDRIYLRAASSSGTTEIHADIFTIEVEYTEAAPPTSFDVPAENLRMTDTQSWVLPVTVTLAAENLRLSDVPAWIIPTSQTLPAESIRLTDAPVGSSEVVTVNIPADAVQLADTTTPQILAFTVALDPEAVRLSDAVTTWLTDPPPSVEVEAILINGESIVRVYAGAHLLWIATSP